MIDLSLIPLHDLVEEIARRASSTLVIQEHILDVVHARGSVHLFPRGSTPACVGLAAYAQAVLMKMILANDQSSTKPDV